jgi:single-stranded DNA-binding protein
MPVDKSPLHYEKAGGSPYAVLSSRPRSPRRNAKDEWGSRTEWHRIIAWPKRGEFVLSLAKGTHFQVEGELRRREYESYSQRWLEAQVLSSAPEFCVSALR